MYVGAAPEAKISPCLQWRAPWRPWGGEAAGEGEGRALALALALALGRLDEAQRPVADEGAVASAGKAVVAAAALGEEAAGPGAV